AAHLVRAVVRAIARADAAVVDLIVQPFGAVHRRDHRADQFARRFLALHAGAGLEAGFGMINPTRVITGNAQPVHLAPMHRLFFADDWDVVFGLARDDAGVASYAGVQINSHAPGVTGVRPFGIERFIRRRFFFAREVRTLAEFVERGRARQIAPFHGVMKLRRGQRLAPARLADRQALAEPRRVGSADRVCVEPHPRAGAAAARATVTEMNRRATVRVTGRDPDGREQFAPLVLQLDDVNQRLAVLAAAPP